MRYILCVKGFGARFTILRSNAKSANITFLWTEIIVFGYKNANMHIIAYAFYCF